MPAVSREQLITAAISDIIKTLQINGDKEKK
jgi:hypothetical protein